MNPVASGWSTVTFNTTADALAGMPARPVTFSCTVPPVGRNPLPTNVPSIVVPSARVSSRRAGAVSGTNTVASAK